MADNKYFDYGKLDATSPYKPGKTSPSAFSKNTLADKANKSALQRKTDLAQTKSSKDQAQLLSSAKDSLTKSLAESLAGNTVNMDSLLSSAVGSKISTKAGQALMSGGSLDTVLSNIGSKISKKA
jgi:hypothetical protein